MSFNIPADWVGTTVDLFFKPAIMDKQNGLGFPSIHGIIKADIPGAIHLLVDNKDLLFPKENIQHITKAAAVSVAHVMPLIKPGH